MDCNIDNSIWICTLFGTATVCCDESNYILKSNLFEHTIVETKRVICWHSFGVQFVGYTNYFGLYSESIICTVYILLMHKIPNELKSKIIYNNYISINWIIYTAIISVVDRWTFYTEFANNTHFSCCSVFLYVHRDAI